MVDIPTIEPDSVTAGDLVNWTKSFSDYPATSWTLSYVLINQATKITITGSAYNVTDHLISVPAATTAAWAAGTYKWQAYMTSGGNRATIASGEITIKPNFASASTLDTRSHVKRTLDAIEAIIESRASLDQQEYMIEGRKLVRMPIEDLVRFRTKYRTWYLQELNAEKIANGKGTKNRILVRM